MGRKAYLDSSDKLQRKLAKVERKRVLLRRLCSLQVLAVVPFGVFVSWSGEPVEGEPEPERSVLAYYQARSPPHPSLTTTIARIPLCVWAQTALAVVWALVGLLGLFAATVRRLQSVSEHICCPTRHRRASSLFCASGALTFCAAHGRTHGLCVRSSPSSAASRSSARC